MRRTVVALAIISATLFAVSASAWDTYVFIDSSLLLCKGKDPYAFSHWVGAYIPGLGPMWIAYPPLMLFFWTPLICALKLASVSLSLPYLWAIKLPSVIALALSAYVAEKIKKGSWVYVLFNPISIAAIFAHGMFDSVTALFLLLSIYFTILNRAGLSGLNYGLALASKQHALIALPAFLVAWKKRNEPWKFVASAIVAFTLVVLAYGSLVGLRNAMDDVMSVFLFHAERPPNALGFGGFAVLSLYGDAFGNYAGNLADATLMHGTATTLHSVVLTASVPAAIMILIVSFLFELPTAVFLSYTVYILLFYVGALQHMVVPASLLYIAIDDKKIKKMFTVSYLAYASSHLLAFWDIFPMLVSPLALKPFDSWLSMEARLFDVAFPYWDLLLKGMGIVLTLIGLVTLLLTTAKYMDSVKRRLGNLLLALYLLEIALLLVLLKGYASASFTSAAKGSELCGIYPWENLEFPGRKFGDFMSSYALPPKEGYFSLVLPITERIARLAKSSNVEVVVIPRIDLIRSYELSDLLSSLIKHGVKWVWGVVISDKIDYYLKGLSSAPPSELSRLAAMIKANTPIKGYFKLGGILGILNSTLIRIQPPVYPYPVLSGKPLVIIIPYEASNTTLAEAIGVFKQAGFVPEVMKVPIANVKAKGLGPSSKCIKIILDARSYPQP